MYTINNSQIPPFLYGTAWKEDRTEALTTLAIKEGFRGIDTANQRRHYYEAAVGRAISAAIKGGEVSRDALFLQTKYTFRHGQDHRLPYDPQASIPTQVQQSFNLSLEHLETDYIDSYLLHGPTMNMGLTTADWEAWQAIEAVYDTGQARIIGVSNFNLKQLEELCAEARVKPQFVQNRCYAVHGWDYHVRAFCAANGIVYQGFSLLTANRHIMADPKVVQMGNDYGKEVAQIIFRFAHQVGMLCLTGTTNGGHMRADLDIFDFQLTEKEVQFLITGE